MSLLERDDQLLVLEAALEAARQGAEATVLVSGEAGTGKSWPATTATPSWTRCWPRCPSPSARRW
jgi:hypothetical protein